jgi:urease gamma subunit
MDNFDLKKYLAEGKLSEGVWKQGNPDDIRDFIKKIAELKRDYWEVVGSDTVMDGIDSAIDEAKILLDIKMGNVQPEEFDLEINEGIGDFEREVLSDEMVMEKIKDLIRDNAVDPSDVLEEIGQEFGIAFEFGRG